MMNTKYFILFLLFLSSLSVFSEQIVWKKQDTSFINNILFSRDGNYLLIKYADKGIILDRITGNEIRPINNPALNILSGDFSFGLSIVKDTVKVFDTNQKIEISGFVNKIDYDTTFNKDVEYLISPDNKYILCSVSLWKVERLFTFGKTKGWVDIFDIKNGQLIRSVGKHTLDSIGYIGNLFFDLSDTNILYISSCILNIDIDKDNDTIIKNIFEYNLAENQLKKIYTIYTNSQFNILPNIPAIQIEQNNPSGCIIFNDDMAVGYRKYPGLYTYHQFDEGLDIRGMNWLKNGNPLVASGGFYPIKDISLYEFSCQYFSAACFLRATEARSIDKYKNYKGSMTLTTNPYNNWFAVALKQNGEIIMYSDSINSDVDENKKNDEISITPNPATNFIEISNAEGEVRIWDVYGQCVIRSTPFNSPASGGQLRIDVSALAPGLYFVRMSDKVEKFVKL